MKPGDHGSTFAGNPLVCNAACAVLDVIAEPSFLEAVERKGERLREGLRKGLAGNPHVKEVRGLGLICGIQLDQVHFQRHTVEVEAHCPCGAVLSGAVCVQPASGVCESARDNGLIVITAGAGDVVRLVPPLTITEDDVDQAVAVLTKVISEL